MVIFDTYTNITKKIMHGQFFFQSQKMKKKLYIFSSQIRLHIVYKIWSYKIAMIKFIVQSKREKWYYILCSMYVLARSSSSYSCISSITYNSFQTFQLMTRNFLSKNFRIS